MTINREGFLTILANLWPTWISKETIQKAGKKMGISSSGLSVDWMQKDNFDRAAGCIKNEDSVTLNPESIIASISLIQHLFILDKVPQHIGETNMIKPLKHMLRI